MSLSNGDGAGGRPVKRRRIEGKVVNFTEEQQIGNHGAPQDSLFKQTGQPQKGRLKQRSLDLLSTRQRLPIWSHDNEIRQKVQENDVVLLVGETGSGKSTQIPQFLIPHLKRTVQNGVKVGGTIAITQPRRVAAISLARRVAEEMGTPLGNSSPASQVGYSVRFDNSVSPSTKVKFLTDGMLLQELLRDPWLKEYSVIVVDEVHERGVNVDLVLGFLKRLIEGRNDSDGRGGVPLKVVIMSATADMERIQDFFAQKKTNDADPESTSNGHNLAEAGETNAKQSEEPPAVKMLITVPKVTSCYIKGRQFPVQIHYIPQPVPNALDAAMERIIQIHNHMPLPGDILVFMSGQEMIESLESMCINYATTLQAQSKQKGAPKLPKLLILPLFAALPTAAQQRVFESTPPFTRKIIISTNIAETSVTVPGIRHVIDTGKRKVRLFRPSLNLDTLLSKSISRSSANQRAGRAGREAPGNCYRLYTEKAFYELDADTEPEILRCDLSQLVLTLKAHSVDDILDFSLLSTPPLKSLERALLHLLCLKALDRNSGHISPLGRQISKIPLPASLARILLASQTPQYDCSKEIIDIVSALSVENIWLPIHNTSKPNNPTEPPAQPSIDVFSDDEEFQNPIAQARSTLYRREGDHLTLLSAVQAYTTENADRKEWCRRHGISHRAMTAAMDVRKQLTKIVAQSSRTKPSKKKKQKVEERRESEVLPAPLPPISSSTTPWDMTAKPTRILQCLLLGLSSNTARLAPSTHTSSRPSTTTNPSGTSVWTGPYTHTSTLKALSIHPSSVLFSRSTRPAMIMFSEFVVTGRAYARGVSAIEEGWVDGVVHNEEEEVREVL